MIEIIDIRKTLDGQEVLKGVTLRIEKGELVAIVGRSGVGKSVLLKHMLGLYKPDSGSIVIEGLDIVRFCTRELCKVRERFGVVFQGGALFDSMSIFDNVAFPLRERLRLNEQVVRQKVEEVLEDVGLLGHEHKFPAELSGGMRKRAALARALVTEPSIVLFDEPTTGLDPITLNSIHRLIESTHKKYNFTGVIVSHDVPEVFSIVDKVAMLDMGRVVEFGTPEEITKSRHPLVRAFITGSPYGLQETQS